MILACPVMQFLSCTRELSNHYRNIRSELPEYSVECRIHVTLEMRFIASDCLMVSNTTLNVSGATLVGKAGEDSVNQWFYSVLVELG
jgi:hypothetical protein